MTYNFLFKLVKIQKVLHEDQIRKIVRFLYIRLHFLNRCGNKINIRPKW